MRYLITGANRGIGLEFVKQLTKRGDSIIATARDLSAAEELSALAKEHDNLRLVSLDISDDASIAKLAADLSEPIDVLINNAGCYGNSGTFPNINFELIARDYQINAIGTLKVCSALLDNVKAGDKKIIASISSKMGSIGDNSGGGAYGYRMSKVGLNMASRSMSRDLQNAGVSVFVLHPGWVQTDMGGANAMITPTQSVEGMLRTIDVATMEHSGRFWEWNGNEIPW